MKLRQGFVSNSSSASYIVTITGKIKNIIENIIGNTPIGFKNIGLEYENKINELKNVIATNKKDSKKDKFESLDKLKKMWVKYDEEELKSATKFLEQLNLIKLKKKRTDKDNFTMVKNYLTFKGINVSTAPSGMTLDYFTVMHNSYLDMSDTLKSIILYYSFENPLAITLKIETIE